MSTDYIVPPQLWCSQVPINPATFVMVDTSNDFGVVPCVENGRSIGIVSPALKYPPNSGIGGTNSGVAFEYMTASSQVVSDGVFFYGPGSVCLLQVGSAGWTRGDTLQSDSLGRGATTTTTLHAIGAIALESGSSGEFRKVMVVHTTHP